MSGKKVFTHAGEKLAEFLITFKNDINSNLNLSQAIINILGSASSTNGIYEKFNASHQITREETIAFFKTEINKELDYLNVTDGKKKILITEMVQTLYNRVNHLTAVDRSTYIALREVTLQHLADIYGNRELDYRKFTEKDDALTTEIANLMFKPLDYFEGGKNDKDRLFYRFRGNILEMSNGAGTNVKDEEIFRVEQINATTKNQNKIGKALSIGGLATGNIEHIDFTKPVNVEGNVTLTNGEFIGTATKSRFADLAEYYTSDKEYRPGTLLQISNDYNKAYQSEVCIFTFTSGMPCVGVVSDNPGFYLNEELRDDTTLITIPVVLTGRSPVRVYGTVEKGDILYPGSLIPGTAQAVSPLDRATIKELEEMGLTRIGYALESYQLIEIDTLNNHIYESLILAKLASL